MPYGERLYYNTAEDGTFPDGLLIDGVYGGEMSPLVLHEIGGYVPPGGVPCYLLLFDMNAVGVGEGFFARQSFPLTPGATFAWEPALSGLKFRVALSYALSTNPARYVPTIGASAFMFYRAVDLKEF